MSNPNTPRQHPEIERTLTEGELIYVQALRTRQSAFLMATQYSVPLLEYTNGDCSKGDRQRCEAFVQEQQIELKNHRLRGETDFGMYNAGVIGALAEIAEHPERVKGIAQGIELRIKAVTEALELRKQQIPSGGEVAASIQERVNTDLTSDDLYTRLVADEYCKIEEFDKIAPKADATIREPSELEQAAYDKVASQSSQDKKGAYAALRLIATAERSGHDQLCVAKQLAFYEKSDDPDLQAIYKMWVAITELIKKRQQPEG